MFSEPFKIIFRRFVDRLTESGFLIISVALGVGAFAASGTLFVNVVNQNDELLNSPTYKEIVVSTRAEKETMEFPVEETLLSDDTILTQSDLNISQMIPSIDYAYIMNNTRLKMINESFINDSDNFQHSQQIKAINESSSNETHIDENSQQMELEDSFLDENIDDALNDKSIVKSDADEISGYEITFEFFDAWNLSTEYGSLFSTNDYSSTNSLIILGSELAKTLLDDDEDLSSLIGKRLLAMQGYQTIVGILEDSNSTYDYQFFLPYNDLANNIGFSQLRKNSMNTQLRFSVSDSTQLESVSSMLEQSFESEFGKNQVIISNPRFEAEQTVARNAGISILILLLAISGLFISSINIAHILLSRTLRMKKHVGILMALGATRKQINKLFSLEAIMIIVLGTVLGLFIAIPINRQMQSALNLTINSNWTILVSAFVSSILIFSFTLIPIRRFDRIKPADAMRVG